MKLNSKKLTLALGFLAAMAAAPATVSAATMTYTDVDVINQSMTFGTGTAVYNGTFNFQPADGDSNTFTATGFGVANGTYNSVFGYQIGTPIIEGSLSFFFKDPNGGSETASVTALFTTIGNVSSFATYSVFSEGLEFNILTSISLNGKLDYTVTTTSGDLSLVAGIGSITVTVPDNGTTLTLLGGSLCGMISLRKRLFRVKA